MLRLPREARPPALRGPDGIHVVIELSSVRQVRNVSWEVPRLLHVNVGRRDRDDVPRHLAGQALGQFLQRRGPGGRRHHAALGEPRLNLPASGRTLRQLRPRHVLGRAAIRVGLFVQRWYARRKFELAFGVALRAALKSLSATDLPYFEVHVVAFNRLHINSIAAALRRAVPASLHAEVHVISRHNKWGSDELWQQNSYMAGVHKAVSVCYARNLTHMVNTDDDIMFEPSALAGLLASARYLHPRSECGVIAPVNPTGCSSSEMFFTKFISDNLSSELHRCFAKSELPEDYGMSHGNFSFLKPIPDPWNADAWFDKVAALPYEDHCQAFGFRELNSVCNNLCAHPVRLDSTCMSMATRIAVEALIAGSIRNNATWLTSGLPYVDVPEPAFPYFCNSVWVMRLADYERVLGSYELFMDGIDETAMSRWTHRSERKVCFLRDAFVLHPAYSSNLDMALLEFQAFAGMMAHLQRKYPEAYRELGAKDIYQDVHELKGWSSEARAESVKNLQYLMHPAAAGVRIPSLDRERVAALGVARRR